MSSFLENKGITSKGLNFREKTFGQTSDGGINFGRAPELGSEPRVARIDRPGPSDPLMFVGNL